MVHCGELCYAEGIVTASIRVLSSIATHGRHDVEAVSCGYSVPDCEVARSPWGSLGSPCLVL